MDQLFAQLMSFVFGVWRRRWYVILVAWVVAVPGWYYVYSMPDQYQAPARVYVDTESLLQPLLSGMTVRPQVEQKVEMVTRTLLSRPNLEEVARQSDLDLRASGPREMEALITGLREKLNLSGSGRENLYAISYTHEDPELARKVVQSLLNVFVESSLGSTRKDIASSKTFIDNQINAYREKLDRKEEEIKEFKRKNHGLLPGQGEDYYSQLKSAKSSLEEARLALEEATSRRNTLQARLQGTEPVLLESPGSSASSVSTELDGRIDALETKLDDLRTRYTDQHPDVQATRRMLEDLRERREKLIAERKAARSQNASSQYADSALEYVQNMQYSLAQAESDVASLQARVKEYQKRYRELKAAVDKIPAVEAEYKSLTRDYEVLKTSYERLLSTAQKAELSGDVESQTKGVEFRVVDPPFVPSEPAGPNRLVFASAVLLLALAGGTGVGVAMSEVWRVVDSRQNLAQIASRPFLGAVSFSPQPRERRMRNLRLLAFAASAIGLVGLYAAVILYFGFGA